MPRSFVRQLGFQPGVQLNPINDATAGVVADNEDQIFAVAGRFPRGRIDKPFVVDRSTIQRYLGINDPLRSSQLNETYEQVYEALSNGAYQAVVYRLHTAAAAAKWIVIDASAAAAAGQNPTTFTVAPAQPNANYTIALLHKGCFNDGIQVEFHADVLLDKNTQLPVANPLVNLYVVDPITDQTILDITGSLDPTSRDDFGNSNYLPDVLSAFDPDDEFDIAVFAGATIPTDSPGYGNNPDGSDKNAASSVLVAFTEGGTAYTESDYDNAVAALKYNEFDYGYIMTGGNRAPGLITRLAKLAYDTNTIMKLDVPGDLSPAAAIAWFAQLGIDSSYVHAYWAPILADLPSGSGRGIIGAAGLNTAFSCKRNAVRDGKGFAKKNFPIGGASWPLNRTRMKQIYTPSEQELSALAKAHIIPVLYETYNGGGNFVFTDCLTGKKSQTSLLKLTTVSEMSADVDTAIARASKEYSILPMTAFIERMEAFLDAYLGGAASAGWFVPAAKLDGAKYAYTVKRSDAEPADVAIVNAYTSYDGVARQTYITQNLVS